MAGMGQPARAGARQDEEPTGGEVADARGDDTGRVGGVLKHLAADHQIRLIGRDPLAAVTDHIDVLAVLQVDRQVLVGGEQQPDTAVDVAAADVDDPVEVVPGDLVEDVQVGGLMHAGPPSRR